MIRPKTAAACRAIRLSPLDRDGALICPYFVRMPGLDEYPNVKRSHIVPRMYLRAWADGQTIAMHRLGDGKVELRNIKSVGIQKRYYRRTRPTGEKIDDVEWSLGQGEDAAAPLLSRPRPALAA